MDAQDAINQREWESGELGCGGLFTVPLGFVLFAILHALDK
jgi:hypothetical protein